MNMLIKLKITDITCGACVKLCQSALNNLPGVTAVSIENDGRTALEADRSIGLSEINKTLAGVDKKAALI